MSHPSGSTRVVSVLGHPVAGLAPISFLSAGWILLGLKIVPWARDSFAEIASHGGRPSLTALLPPPAPILLLGIAALGSLVLGIGMLAVWIKSAGGFEPLSDPLLRRSTSLAGIVVIASGVLTAALLSAGYPTIEEARSQIACGTLWFDFLHAGTIPRWTDAWYAGCSADQHGPPLAHILQALIGFLRFEPHTAAKMLAWFCRMGGAVGASLLCARLHRDQRAGLLGGILYALAPTIHADWIWAGRLPSALLAAILPWAFLAAERVATGVGGTRAGAGLAMAVAALALAETTEARAALVLLGAFTLLRAVPTAATRGARAPSVVGLATGWIGGAALVALFLVPIEREIRDLAGTPGIGPGGLSLHPIPAASIVAALRWSAGGTGYLGLSILFLCVGGIVRASFDRREGGRGIGPLPLAVLALLPWALLPSLPRSKDLITFGALLAAAGVGRKAESAPRLAFARRGVYPLALLLVIVDLAAVNLVTSYGAFPERREKVYGALKGRLLSGRLLELTAGRDGRPVVDYGASSVPAGFLATVLGPSPGDAPRAFLHQAAMVDTVARAVASGRPLDRDLLRLLEIHNVRYLMMKASDRLYPPRGVATAGLTLDPDIQGLRIEAAAPVAVLEPGCPKGPATPPRGRAIELPIAAARALVREEIAWVRQARPRLVAEARAVVLPNRLEIVVPDLGAVTVRVERNPWPGTRVLLDGRPWEWREGPLGGIALDLAAGPHRIEVWGVEDRVRKGCRYAQWGLMGLLFLIAVGPRRR